MNDTFAKRPLFRTAVYETVKGRHYGTVVLARPFNLTALTLLFAFIALALISFVATFSITRKAQVAGQLLPTQGLIRVQPPQTGVVSRRHAQEGQTVSAGDALFTLERQQVVTSHGDTAATISALLESRRASLVAERDEQRSQDDRRTAALRLRADELATESTRIDDQIRLQQRRVELAAQTVQRYADLQAANFVSAASAQDHESELLDQRQRLADLERAKGANARDRSSTFAELADQQLQTKRNQLTAARSIDTLDQERTENEGRRQIIVRATSAGTVTAIAADTGQVVNAGQTLASILPSTADLEAELYAPSRAAGFIKAGMPVLLRYQAYPYQKFGLFPGRVRDVASAAVAPSELTANSTSLPLGSGEAVYRICVRLDSQTIKAYGVEQHLKSGMTVEASVLLESRRLYEWVLEPLYSITGRI